MRITTFSPKATGRVETRSSISRPPRLVLMRPSWGRRFSAMSRRDIVLMRLTTAVCTTLGISWMLCSTPSMRKRIRLSFALRLDVDVARPRVEGVLEHELDRVDDVLVARLDLGLALHAHELLEIAEVDARLEVALGALDRVAQAVELGERLAGSRARRRPPSRGRGRRCAGRSRPPRGRRGRRGRRAAGRWRATAESSGACARTGARSATR